MALAFNRTHDGLPFNRHPLALIPQPDLAFGRVQTARIGISRAVNRSWEWCVANSPWQSRKS
ncbi:MAG: hypothetical protein U1B82_13990 [Cypionkella sp.]|nr:hypothetical protein [Cypionkella sp.]